jgi:chromosome segregation ATPase
MSTEVDPSVITSAAALLGALGAAGFAWKSSKNATRIEERKVDQAATSAVKLYKEQLEFLQTQLDRMTGQMERMTSQVNSLSVELDSEKHVSQALKEKVAALQVMVDFHQETIKALQATIAKLQAQHITDDPTQKVAGQG